MNLKERISRFLIAFLNAVWERLPMEARRFVVNTRGEPSGDITEYIIGVCIALFVAGVLLAPSIADLVNTSAYGGASPAVTTMATVLLPLLAIVGIALALYKRSKRG